MGSTLYPEFQSKIKPNQNNKEYLKQRNQNWDIFRLMFAIVKSNFNKE